jgi:UPF0755 protein
MERPRLYKFSPKRPRPKLSARFLLLAGFCAIFVTFIVQVWLAFLPTQALQAAPRVVEIPRYLSVVEVAKQLKEAEVIPSQTSFLLLTALRGSQKSLKAGEYEFPQGASTLQILKFMENGKVKPHNITLSEGGMVRDLARILEREGLTRADDVVRASTDPAILKTLDVDAPSLEGYLFPDTYQLFKGMTIEEILAKMVRRLREVVTSELIAEANARNLTLHQLLIMASIIEREAVVPSEHPIISGVFWNRLRRNMPLQADPTVQYAVGKGYQALTREDLLTDSPYNTYRYQGLPPTPIASPGKSSILAALRPAPVKYLYFVSIDNRYHYFSTTIDQHNSAVARYRLVRANNK